MSGQEFRVCNRNHSKEGRKHNASIRMKEIEQTSTLHKNKYQTSNIDELVDGISQICAKRKAGDVYFTTLDFAYAYGQVALDQKTSEQCNFMLVGSKNGNISMGTYRFRTAFVGLLQCWRTFKKL